MSILHGNGIPALQWRGKPGEDTNAWDLPFEGPGTVKLKMLRTGVKVYLYLAKEGAELKEIAHTEVSLGNPVISETAAAGTP